mgnify:CR=1 FL=1|jgi:hypothetical protein|tara:strand:- start:2441 stop:2644 length:204 start_codon:yes stop_codon:yes gene_type:complete
MNEEFEQEEYTLNYYNVDDDRQESITLILPSVVIDYIQTLQISYQLEIERAESALKMYELFTVRNLS